MPYIDGLGDLHSSPDVPQWLASAAVAVPFFGGAALPFVVHDAEEWNAPDVAQAIKNFLSLRERARQVVTPYVVANYHEMLELTDINPLPINDEQDIWTFVHPDTIYVSRRH